MHNKQLPLHLKLPDTTVFESFFAGPNSEAVDYLSGDQRTMTWIWGESSSGKTHLLQSAAAASDQSVYLPLAELRSYGPFVLDGYNAFDVVCIDQLDAIIPSYENSEGHGRETMPESPSSEPAASLVESSGGDGLEPRSLSQTPTIETANSRHNGAVIEKASPERLSENEQKQWEEALFRLYQDVVVEHQKVLVVASQAAPKNCRFIMPDLASRLLSGPVFRLQSLNDEQRLAAIQLRAKRRGLELPEKTGNYLLRRLNRDMRSLCELLDRLDTASLVHQSKLTIPLVKATLDRATEGAHSEPEEQT